MAWATPLVELDRDKQFVGTVTFTFTDTDATVFIFATRTEGRTVAQMQALWAAAVTERNNWRTKKSQQNTMTTALVNNIPSGETIG